MGASAWINHVKAYHKKHGGSYSASLKAASKTWKKGSGAAEDGKKKRRKRRKK